MCQGAEQNDEKSASKTKEEVLKIEEEANQAVLTRSSSMLDALIADEMVWLTHGGEILTKAQVLASTRSGKLTGFSEKTDDRQLHVHGDTVVLYTTTRPQGGNGSKGRASPKMTTTVFVKQAGVWKIVAYGETVVMQQ